MILVDDAATALQSVDGRPFLAHLASEAARFGFTSILALAASGAAPVRDALAQSGLDLSIEVLVDEVLAGDPPAGGAGALWRARDRLDERFFVLDGDSWFDFNWLSLLTAEGADAAIATVARRRDDGREAPAGVALVSREIVAHLAPSGSLARDVFPRLAQAGALSSVAASGRFVDVAAPGGLALARAHVAGWRKRPAVFLDRDGTLNEDSGYVYRSADFRWLPGAIEGVRRLNDAGVYVFVVTNQSGVARGLYNEGDVKALHAWVQRQLREEGAHIDDFRYCPSHPDGPVEAYRRRDTWRKPEPGMLIDLADHWPIDMSRSVMIGDKDIDVEAGRGAGVESVKIGPEGILPAIDDAIARVRDAGGAG